MGILSSILAPRPKTRVLTKDELAVLRNSVRGIRAEGNRTPETLGNTLRLIGLGIILASTIWIAAGVLLWYFL